MSCTTTLTNIGDFAKFTQGKPLHYITNLTGWVEQLIGTGTLRREFRWGTTNRVRASWMDLTVPNLTQVILKPDEDLYVDFRFTLISGGPITVEDLYVEFTQAPEALDKFVGYRPPLLVSETGNISNLTKIENFTFRPYQVNPAVVLYKELASTVNKLFGHDVQYARVVPMAVGRDFTLHEWTLYDVDDPCCVKVIVPNNEFPDSKIQFNPFGLDFEIPFEVHIVKDYFEEIFGLGTGPQKRDIIFFPLTNRIYEIESSYLWKDIMQKEVYWKVSLKKYQPKSNRYEPQDLQEQFADITYTSKERFTDEVELDEIKDTKPQQYDPKIGSRDYDPTRLSVNNSMVITEVPLMNYSNILSESQYDLRSIFDITTNTTAVTYRAKSVWPIDEDRSFCCWFKELKAKTAVSRDPVRGQLVRGVVGATETPISFVIAANRNYQVNDLIKITRFNGLSVYGRFVSSTPIVGGFVIQLLVRNDIIQFLDLYYQNWTSASVTSGYHAELTSPTTLIDGYDSALALGWKLEVYASRYVILTENSNTKLFSLSNDLIENSWYAFFLNVSNYYQQVSLDVWVRNWSETDVNPQQTTNLQNIYSNAVFDTAIVRSASAAYNYRLPASNMSLTNIRLFNHTETDLLKQVLILNQNIVQDSQFAIIIDNAVQRLQLPFIGQTK